MNDPDWKPMTRFVVRCNRTDDAYVLWSTVVDAPSSCVCTFAEMTELLDKRGEVGDGRRVERARSTGTSGTGLCANDFAWTENTIVVANILPGLRELRRNDLLAFVRAAEREDDAAMLALTSPIDDKEAS